MERRKFTREFKLEAVKLNKERGVTVAQASRDLGVHGTVLRNWVKAFADDPEHSLTNAFSKKVENLRAAVSLHFAHYNFVRLHKTLRTTPAMAAGVSDKLWMIEELVERTSA
jgi:hypothetical protein